MKRFFSEEEIEVLTIFIKEIIVMSDLTNKMTVALATLESKLATGGVTLDQVTAQIHSVVDPQISALTDSIATINASEADDATKIADLTAAVTQFTDAFAPAPAPAPAADAGTSA